MPAYIHDIVTSNPTSLVLQDAVRENMKEKVGKDRKTQHFIHRIYKQSGIEKRHTVFEDAFSSSSETFFNRTVTNASSPGTAERNEIYKNESTTLFLDIGKQLLINNPSFSKDEITHVITISCTGFYAPGPDFELVKHLGLNPSTQRYHIGFMGCYAAFQGMKLASTFCEADPKAKVMVISCELCTLHFQNKTDIDSLIATSVFADGAAGFLVSTEVPKNGYLLKEFANSLAYEGEQDMAWTIGNHGFNMILSNYVPDIISANLETIISDLFASLSVSEKEVSIWAIHPGGRAIIDKVVQTKALTEDQVAYSRKVLANYGNMSSATVLFVLKEILDSSSDQDEYVLPIAFGPGLTIETGLLRLIRA